MTESIHYYDKRVQIYGFECIKRITESGLFKIGE